MGFADVLSGNKFYETLASTSSAPVIGQLAWTPVPHLPEQPDVIEAIRVNDSDHEVAMAKYARMTDVHFKHRPYKRYPILNINLEPTEELVAFKAKRRPCVIICANATQLGNIDRNAPSHHEERRIVAVPIYGRRSEDEPKGFGPILAVRVEHLMYRQFFPIAPWQEPRRGIDGAESLKGGIARFDRLQFVNPAPPGLRLMPLKVTDEVFRFMHAMLVMYLNGTSDPELVAAMQVLREFLPKEAEPPV
ncbi:hypothetical protein WMF26_38890 [Sorangium sp. So ce185]|uniref:hypothetical protein n=1 Tax=Sorangium sp. So ce185 TaxID=3133287 RepID=UPI003F616666